MPSAGLTLDIARESSKPVCSDIWKAVAEYRLPPTNWIIRLFIENTIKNGTMKAKIIQTLIRLKGKTSMIS